MIQFTNRPAIVPYKDTPAFVHEQLGKLRTYIDQVESSINEGLTGRRAASPKPSSVVSELLDLDAVSLKVYMIMLAAQNATAAPVTATRKDLAAILHRKPRTISTALHTLRQKELIYRLGMSRYSVRTTGRDAKA